MNNNKTDVSGQRADKRKFGLLGKFTVVFLVFIIITLTMISVFTFFNQTDIYRENQETRIQQVAGYLDRVITADGEEFLWYQEYFLKHTKDLRIPHDFGPEERDEAGKKWQSMFAETYPGKALGTDVKFEDMPEELQEAYTIYNHMYYVLLFEQAVKEFGLMYTYYITPFGDEPYTMCYVIDALREELSEDGKTYILITDEIFEDPEKYPVMWETWNTGKRLSGFDKFDNEFGKTYAYYAPLFIGDVKAGLICVDVEIASVQHGIIMQTVREILIIGAVLIIAVFILLQFINRQYISKIENLAENVQEYALDKDPVIASKIEKTIVGNDEITALANQTAAMIMELDNYMKDLVKTTQELTDTKKKADNMQELAIKDPLTGIRNKTAYDNEIRKLEAALAGGFTEFGLAMVDLNFLKKINDTFGHEKGDIAIKKLCTLVCEIFEHSPVFRIGGDEFIIILKGRDYRNVDSLIKEFHLQIEESDRNKELEPWEKISGAIGYAKYDRSKDDDIESIFARADQAMYENKKQMKAERQDE